MARPKNEDTKDEKTESETQSSAAPKKVATYNKDEAGKVTVQTTGDFQLYDPVSQTMYKKDEKVERPDNDRFVTSNIKNGKLKKV